MKISQNLSINTKKNANYIKNNKLALAHINNNSINNINKLNIFNLNFTAIISPEDKAKNFFMRNFFVGQKIAEWDDITGSKTVKPNPETAKIAAELENLSLPQKKAFVKEFERITGFPDLKEVSKNIEQSSLNAVKRMAKERDLKVVFAGYDKNCSVGQGFALPGSDLDAFLIVVDGPDARNKALDLKKNFSNNVNQRLLSCSGDDLPDVISLDELKETLNGINHAVSKTYENLEPDDLERTFADYQKRLNSVHKDYVEAARFNIDVKHNFNGNTANFIDACNFVEQLRDGKVIINNIEPEFFKEMENTHFFKMSNLLQERVLGDIDKEKWSERERVLQNYSNWDDEPKFDFVKTVISNSLGIKPEENNPFYSCFCNNSLYFFFDNGSICRLYEKLRR